MLLVLDNLPLDPFLWVPCQSHLLAIWVWVQMKFHLPRGSWLRLSMEDPTPPLETPGIGGEGSQNQVI